MRLLPMAGAWGVFVSLPPTPLSAKAEALIRQPPKLVYTFDAQPLNRLDLQASTNAAAVWDTLHLLAALQGLANREAPQFYLFYCSEFGVDTDRFWFDWFRGEDGWLKDSEIRPLTTLAEAVKTFRPLVEGMVVYDPAVPATSDVASTTAGCDAPCCRCDSIPALAPSSTGWSTR